MKNRRLINEDIMYIMSFLLNVESGNLNTSGNKINCSTLKIISIIKWHYAPQLPMFADLMALGSLWISLESSPPFSFQNRSSLHLFERLWWETRLKREWSWHQSCWQSSNVCVMTVLIDCSGVGVRAVINDSGRSREILSTLKSTLNCSRSHNQKLLAF